MCHHLLMGDDIIFEVKRMTNTVDFPKHIQNVIEHLNQYN